MMDCLLKMMDFVQKLMDFVQKLMDFVQKLMDCLLKTMDFLQFAPPEGAPLCRNIEFPGADSRTKRSRPRPDLTCLSPPPRSFRQFSASCLDKLLLVRSFKRRGRASPRDVPPHRPGELQKGPQCLLENTQATAEPSILQPSGASPCDFRALFGPASAHLLARFDSVSADVMAQLDTSDTCDLPSVIYAAAHPEIFKLSFAVIENAPKLDRVCTSRPCFTASVSACTRNLLSFCDSRLVLRGGWLLCLQR